MPYPDSEAMLKFGPIAGYDRLRLPPSRNSALSRGLVAVAS